MISKSDHAPVRLIKSDSMASPARSRSGCLLIRSRHEFRTDNENMGWRWCRKQLVHARQLEFQ